MNVNHDPLVQVKFTSCHSFNASLALFSMSDMERLTKEVSTMLSFEHPNVMSLIGVCLDGDMPLLIMPFMSNGSVLQYVKQHKQELLLGSEASEVEVNSVILSSSN